MRLGLGVRVGFRVGVRARVRARVSALACVHVQPKVFSRGVLDHERVMACEAALCL